MWDLLEVAGIILAALGVWFGIVKRDDWLNPP